MSQQPHAVEDPPRKSRGRRHGLLLSGVGGLTLLALVGFLIFQPASFGVDDFQDAASTAELEADVDADPSATDRAAPVALPIVTYDVFLSRDPFEPVVEPVQEIVPVDGTDPNDPDAPLTDPDALPVEPGAPSFDPDAPVLPAGEPACSGTDEVVCAGQVVTLVDVVSSDEEPVAIIQIDSAVHEVTAGMPLSDDFVLRGIDGSCANLSYGDEAFRLCEGDRIMK